MYDTNTPRFHVHEPAPTMFGRSSTAVPEPHSRGEDSSVPRDKTTWTPLPRDRVAATMLVTHSGAPQHLRHELATVVPDVGQEEDIDLTEAIVAGKVTLVADVRREHGLSLEASQHINPIGNSIISELSLTCCLDGAPLDPGTVVTITLFRNIPRPIYVQTILNALESMMTTSTSSTPQHRIMASYMATAMEAAASGVALNHKTMCGYLNAMNTTAIPVGVPRHGITVHQTLEEARGDTPTGQTCNVHCTLSNHTKQAEVVVVSIPDSQRKSTYFHGNMFMHLGIHEGSVRDSEGYPTYKFTINLSPGSVWATHKRRDGSAALQPHADHHAVARAFCEIWRQFVLSTMAAPDSGACLTAGILDESGKKLSGKYPRIVMNTKTTETFMDKAMDAQSVSLASTTDGRTGGAGGGVGAADPSSTPSHGTLFTPRMDIITAAKFCIFAINNAIENGYPILSTGDMFLRVGHRKLYTGKVVLPEPAKTFREAKSHSMTSDFLPEIHGDDTPSAPPTYLTTIINMKTHLLSPGNTRMGPQLAGCLPSSRLLVEPVSRELKADTSSFSPA